MIFEPLKRTYTSLSGEVLRPTVDETRKGKVDKYGHLIWGDEDVENFVNLGIKPNKAYKIEEKNTKAVKRNCSKDC